MGLFDKLKNLLYYDEEVEVQNNTSSAKQNSKINEEENNIEKKDKIDDVISERDLVKSKQDFKFPIIFEDEDFVDIKPEPKKEIPAKRVEESKYTQKYQRPTLDREVIKEVIEKPKKFVPSPVISPVYGVLDKNYQKTEKDESKDSLEKTKELIINFETIRKKAFGTLSDDIENELATSNSDDKINEIEKEIDNILEENNLLSDLKNDDEPTTIIDNSIEQEIDNNDFDFNFSDFGVEYKIEKNESIEDDILSMKEESTETVEINKELKDDEKKEDTKKNQETTKENDLELTEDLFNLIDSMYDR